MTSEVRASTPAREKGAVAIGAGVPRFELADHNCFACGALNTGGLGLTMHVERGRSWTETTLDRRFEGWERIAHGGIVCTILDEVMAWALVGDDNWGVTARLSVQFKRPVEIDRSLRAEGWVTRARRRLMETEARLVDAGSGEVLAVATGLYLAADEARKRELRERYGFRLVDGESDMPGRVDRTGGASPEATR